MTRSNQKIQGKNWQFYGALNHFGHMVFTANQEKNNAYTFKYM